MQTISLDTIKLMVRTMAETAVENEKYFSELDAVVGDADFGVSLANGFKVVIERWEELNGPSIGDFLMQVGMIITSNVGGCSGPIWGTGFLKAGMASKGKKEVSLKDLVSMLRDSIEGMMARGGASAGDKTLLDAVIPVTDKLEEWSQRPDQDFYAAFDEAASVAWDTIESTKGWEAKRGRQSFTGERSMGTLDPGIVAVATMMKDINSKFRDKK